MANPFYKVTSFTIISLVMLSCLILPSDSTFTPRFMIDLPGDYTHFEYSDDHSLLGIASDTKLLILNAHTN
jgi:hypothetical protein